MTLAEIERQDPFAPHDRGCRCWPHVSQRAAIEAATQAATAEYRAARATAPGDDLGAAWEAVERALPEWWAIRSVIRLSPDVWEVVASGDKRITTARGPSVAAAFRELASRHPAS